MSVYVDKSRNRFGRMIMCHMVADTLEELHKMAHKIGIKRKWFQQHSALPHYDICLSKRILAIRFGAIEIDRNEMARRIRLWRDSQMIGIID